MREGKGELDASMDLWNRARVFAEEAAKKSQEISIEAAKKSQELFLTRGIGVAKEFSHDFVSEASKKAELIKIEALKRADQIKSLASDIEIPNPIARIVGEDEKGKKKKGEGEGEGEEEVKKDVEEELEKFGVTENLREFVKGITISTFRDFPMEDEPEMADVPTVSNIRQDLNEWQARHATLVLSAVKEISKFRYELCPRYMKERKFWQIYFILVDNHVIPYQKRYFEAKANMVQQEKDVKDKEAKVDASSSTAEVNDVKLQTKTSKSASAEHDLDVFLLGDLGSDEEPDAGGGDFDDDFDKIDDKALESEDDTEGMLAE